MAEKKLTTSSLKASTLEKIDSFLLNEKFTTASEIISNGILRIIDSISDYYEEGIHLYPELIITNNLKKLDETILSRYFVVKRTTLSEKGFKEAIKLCAPLAIDGWIIFVEVPDEKSLNFGLITTQISETSLSLYKQAIESQDPIKDLNIAYLRNLGKKTVELVGYKKRLLVSLTLDDYESVLNNEVTKLAKEISLNCEPDNQDKISTYFDKIISVAIKIGHGNLIGVVKDDEITIDKLKSTLSDGVYFENPIDFQKLLTDLVDVSTKEEPYITLRQYASALTSMLNLDGITILSDKARVIGYHLFVKSELTEDVAEGGARTRAFLAMCKLDLKACFYKSQDGNIKYFEK